MYFIGYLIEGEAADWHYRTAKEISDKFNTWKIHEKLPPHITIYAPFEAEELDKIRNILREWTEQPMAGNFILSGFEHFDDRVVVADIKTDEPVIESVNQLQKELSAFLSPPEFPEWNPHATLAVRLEPEKINKIWQYVQTLPKPNFTLPFNNITLFKYAGERVWNIEQIFRNI